jgi:hypothetical protein
MDKIECPYCLFELEDQIDDFDEGFPHKFQCPDCKKHFEAVLSVEKYYESFEIEQPEEIEEEVDCQGQVFFDFFKN